MLFTGKGGTKTAVALSKKVSKVATPPSIKTEKKSSKKKKRKTTDAHPDETPIKKEKKAPGPTEKKKAATTTTKASDPTKRLFHGINSSQGYRASGASPKIVNVTTPPKKFKIFNDDGSKRSVKGVSIPTLFNSMEPKLTDAEFLREYVGCDIYDDCIVRMVYQAEADKHPRCLMGKYLSRVNTQTAIPLLVEECEQKLEALLQAAADDSGVQATLENYNHILRYMSDNWNVYFDSSSLIKHGFTYTTSDTNERVILDSRLVSKLFQNYIDVKKDENGKEQSKAPSPSKKRKTEPEPVKQESKKKRTKKSTAKPVPKEEKEEKPPAKKSKKRKHAKGSTSSSVTPPHHHPVTAKQKEELTRRIAISWTMVVRNSSKEECVAERQREQDVALKMLERGGAYERYTPKAFRESKSLAIHAGFLEAPSNQKGGRKPLEKSKPIEAKIFDAAIQVVASSANRRIPIRSTGHIHRVPKHGIAIKRAFTSVKSIFGGVTPEERKKHAESFTLDRLHDGDKKEVLLMVKDKIKAMAEAATPKPKVEKKKKKPTASPAPAKSKKPAPKKRRKTAEKVKEEPKPEAEKVVVKVEKVEDTSSDIYLGDCMDMLKKLPSNSVDMVLCDPPYGTTRNKWDMVLDMDAVWKELYRVTKKDGAMVFTTSEPFSTDFINTNKKHFKYSWIWVKNVASGHLNVNKRPLKKHERIDVFYRKQPTYNKQYTYSTPYTRERVVNPVIGDCYGGIKETTAINNTDGKRHPTSILHFDRVNNKNRCHPTQKPLPLLHYLIKTYTNEGDTVLDFTMGSGSTGVAAKQLGRNFIGIELDEKYFGIAKERINKASPDDKVDSTPTVTESETDDIHLHFTGVSPLTALASLDPNEIYFVPFDGNGKYTSTTRTMQRHNTMDVWLKEHKYIRQQIFGHIDKLIGTRIDGKVAEMARFEWYKHLKVYITQKDPSLDASVVTHYARDFIFAVITQCIEKPIYVNEGVFKRRNLRIVDDHFDQTRWVYLMTSAQAPMKMIKQEPTTDDGDKDSMFGDMNEDSMFEDHVKVEPRSEKEGSVVIVTHETLEPTFWSYTSDEEKKFHTTLLDILWEDKINYMQSKPDKYVEMCKYGKSMDVSGLFFDYDFPKGICKEARFRKSRVLVETFVHMYEILFMPSQKIIICDEDYSDENMLQLNILS